MSFQPYVPPEQLIKYRSDYARKGIAKGRSVVGLEFADGILFLAENPSGTLHKISEIYDREDVTAKTIANAYAQALAMIFTAQIKPYEVELLVGQVGESPSDNELYHILFDGSVGDEKGYVAMGGRSEELTEALRSAYQEGLALADAVQVATRALSSVEERPVDAPNLEGAVLDRNRGRRKFRRLGDD